MHAVNADCDIGEFDEDVCHRTFAVKLIHKEPQMIDFHVVVAEPGGQQSPGRNAVVVVSHVFFSLIEVFLIVGMTVASRRMPEIRRLP
jgi:hypothetical protein